MVHVWGQMHLFLDRNECWQFVFDNTKYNISHNWTVAHIYANARVKMLQKTIKRDILETFELLNYTAGNTVARIRQNPYH